MIAVGGWDSNTGAKRLGEEMVKEGMECEANARSVMMNSWDGLL